MVTCPWCQKAQPTEDILAVHQARFCKSRPADASAPDDLAAVAAPASVAVNGKATPVQSAPAPAKAATSAPDTSGIWIPTPDSHFYLPRWKGEFLDRVVRLADDEPQSIVVEGGPGSGKTSLAQQLAGKYKRPFASVEFGRFQEVSQLFGETRYHPDLGTYYVKSLLWRALETPNAVVLCDEANRAENPKIQNPLLSLLDYRHEAFIDELGTSIKVAPGVVIILTLNKGWEFVGTDSLDKALPDRSHRLFMDYPQKGSVLRILVSKGQIPMSQATTLLSIAGVDGDDSAACPVPLRSLLKAASHIRLGASYRDAVATAFGHLEGDELESALQKADAYDPASSFHGDMVAWG